MGQLVGSSCLPLKTCTNVIIGEVGFSSTFPHDFIGKWPLTRAERIQELDFLSQHYNQTSQSENIAAAKEWHGKFPPNETIPDDIVIFQDGKVVKMSELQPEGGPIWEEVSKCCTFRAVISVNTGVTRSLLRTTSWTVIGSVLHIISRHQALPADVTGNANWTYFE